MAKENVKKFYEEISKNKELQEKLKKAQESYTGDRSNKAEAAEAIIIPIAKEAGFDFTNEELKKAEMEMAKEKGISEEELENVSGGGGFCLLIGGGSECSADIRSGGGTAAFHACAYVGVGIDVWF